MPSLFEPTRLGSTAIANRILMSPMTRARATADHVPTETMIDYYRQRAGAGLILSEATGISLEGLGWPFAPGIWNQQQVAAWKPITAAVHRQGGKIFCQLWHMGRVVHPSFPGRGQPVSSSATTFPGLVIPGQSADSSAAAIGLVHTYEGKQPAVQARALSRAEIQRVVDDYRAAASNAIAAGFDGVQLHAGNGYLIDQFLRDSANFRQDDYGGPIGNRIRFLCEVTAAVADAIGAQRTAVRLSPNGERQGVNDSNPQPLFEAAAAALSDLGIAFLEVREPDVSGTFGQAELPPIAPSMRKAFQGQFVLNSDFDQCKAQAALDAGRADAISFGRPFISNPDLPERMAKKLALAPDDMATWYLGGTNGYTDYARASQG
ncbi:MAG TPA: alkene reductase [Ramlibacter sp.]|nr:alkene reductase [Ramlibacter sp.]